MHYLSGLSASAMYHGHGLNLSTLESIVFTSFFQDVNTFRVTAYNCGTKQILINSATHNSLMGPRRYWWIYWSSEQLKDTTKDLGISVLGLVPLWTWAPDKEGLTTMITFIHLELNVTPVLDGHHTPAGWLPSLTTSKSMSLHVHPSTLGYLLPPTSASSRDLESVEEIVPRVQCFQAFLLVYS